MGDFDGEWGPVEGKHFGGSIMNLLETSEVTHGILSNANIGLWAVEIDEGCEPRMYADEKMLQLLGVDRPMTPEELFLAWYNNVDADHYENVNEMIAQLIEGKHAEVEYPWHHPKIGTMFVRCGGARNDSYNRGVRLEGCHRDISELISIRQQYEESLQFNEIACALCEEYDGIYYVNVENDSYRKFAPKKGSKSMRQVLAGQNFFEESLRQIREIIVKEDLAGMVAFLNKKMLCEQMETQDNLSYEYRILTNGSQIFYRLKVLRLPDVSKHLIFAIENVDAKVRQEQQEQFDAEMEARKNTGIIAGLASEYTSVYYINLATEELTPFAMNQATENAFGETFRSGIRFSEAYSLYVDKFVKEKEKKMMLREGAVENIKQQLMTRKSFVTKFLNFRNHYCEMKFVKVSTERGIPKTVALGFADVDEETRAEMERQKVSEQNLREALERAEAANRAKTAFLNNMSHDIRTPMNAIMGFTEMAIKNIDRKDKAMDSLAKARTSSQHLLALIDDILDMSRIESGKMVIEEKPDDLFHRADVVTPMFSSLAEKKNISFSCDLSQVRDRYVYMDAVRMDQAIINLVSNAVKYTPEGGNVWMSVRQKDGEEEGTALYEFEIRDNGIGMSEEFQKIAFETFSREKTSTISKQQGTGLGLAITKSIVEMMHGKVWLESKPGEGSCFTFCVPLRLQECQNGEKCEDAINPEERDALKGKKVLLVEDNELNREISRDILEESHMVVEEAENGIEALKLLEEKGIEYYQLILMDIQMPEMDGYEATREIRKRYPKNHIPIIALSANAFFEDRTKALEAGMDDHQSKPINTKRFIETMLRLCNEN